MLIHSDLRFLVNHCSGSRHAGQLRELEG